MNKKNILIVCPDMNRLGGVANHYLGLNEYWSSYNIKYEYYGKRYKNTLPAYILFPYDLVKFIFKLFFFRIDFVIVNPSLRKYQIIRDGTYLLLARLFNKKVITFIHGWNEQFAGNILLNPFLFKFVYNKSSFIYVLFSEFRTSLIAIGIKCPILLTTTKVDNKMLNYYDHSKRSTKHIENILFLARVEKTKGIFITLEAFKIVLRTYPYLSLFIIGDGNDMAKAKNYVKINKIPNVLFYGFLESKMITKYFIKSDIYILPTYEEGMPTSVLEAMAFGLPVITRPVGGLNDFFVDGKMGYLIKSLNPVEYAEKIIFLLQNSLLYKNISDYNQKYSICNFLASNVVKQIENDIKNYL